VPERSEGGVVDQVPEKIFQFESDLPPRLAVARRPLLFQEGSFASQSVKYINALTQEGSRCFVGKFKLFTSSVTTPAENPIGVSQSC